MTTVQRPNRDALQRALDIYRDAMRPFIVRCLKRVPGKRVEDVIQNSLQDRQAARFRERLHQGSSIEDAFDINDFPLLLLGNWRDVFSQQLSNRDILNEMWLLVKARNLSAHPSTQDIEPEYTRTQLYHIAQVLGQIKAPNAKRAVEKIRDQRFSAEPATKPPPSPRTPQQTRSARNLTPWREVIKPNADVSRGTFQEAEFAADLQEVYDGRASSNDYGNPVAFFKHTYITPGIRTLLVNTLRRLGGQGGDPVIQTKTGFGGGKTHSLIALYHLVHSSDALITPAQDDYEIRGILEEAGLDPDEDLQARVAVLDGTFLATTDPNKTDAGDPLNTLWGVMAHQLGGQDAYEIIGQAARQGSAPGGAQLDRLFEHVGPCVILMDELVAYVRNAGDAKDSIYTFMQALTQSVRRNDSAALVITLPESAVEAGGEAGSEALSRLDALLGRIEAIWEPLEVQEAFEVVRRRLFDPIQDEAERDRTCEAFARIYNRSDYPPEVTEQRYLERMKACYPIHPEIFDRLYSDWSSIPGFQRTRGVLRMMANCISYLYRHSDASPLILPGTLPLRDEALFNEFVKLLGEQWRPVLSEVDGDNSRPDDIDAQTSRFGAVGGAAKRIARAVFLGSASSRAIKGIDQRQIHLGVSQPGHGVPVYNEALNRMSGSLYYLYSSDGRYYFQAEENLNKVANDRADALNDQEIHAHLVSAIQEATRHTLDAIICPQDSSQVPEAQYAVQLVILPPDTPLPSRSRETDEATAAALDILQQHGDTARVHRNTLLFLAAKGDDLRDLKVRAKRYLAWDSIVNGERRIENLRGDRFRQAKNSLTKAERELSSGLVNAYRQTMDPVQDDPQKASYRIVTSTSTPLGGDIVQSAFGKFVAAESLVEEIAPSALANLLDRYVWDNESTPDHIDIDDLWEMMAKHVYLPRLRNKTVLLKCIEQGANECAFGYAKRHDNDGYEDLRYGESTPLMGPRGIAERTSGLLVNPTMAELVQEEIDDPEPDDPEPDDPKPPDPEPDDPKPGPKHITVSKTMENDISRDEVKQLQNEIIRNLHNDGGQVTIEITITISAHRPDGFSENIASSIRENSHQLGARVEKGETYNR